MSTITKIRENDAVNNQMNPLISVLIPAYKKDFLHDAINSVLNQDYPNWECIIVNDASPFDLDTIVKEFSDSRIRYFKNEKNCGAENVVVNWNIALDKAEGEYVICMGDDDMLLPNSLSSYLNLVFKYPNLDIFHARSLIIDEENNIKSVQEARPEYESIFSYIYHNVCVGRRQFIGDYMFRTQPLRKACGFLVLPKGWVSDELSCFRAALDKGIANTQDFAFCYRENAQTITSSIDVPTKLNNRRLKVEWILKEVNSAKSDSVVELFYINSVKNKIQSWENNIMTSEICQDILNNGFKRIPYWRRFIITPPNNNFINNT